MAGIDRKRLMPFKQRMRQHDARQLTSLTQIFCASGKVEDNRPLKVDRGGRLENGN